MRCSPEVYRYFVYGLSLKSHIAIDGLVPSRGLPGFAGAELEIADAASIAGAAFFRPRKLIYSSHQQDPENATFRLYLSDQAQFFQLWYRDGARFVVDEATRRMWVEGPPELTPEDLATYLLGPVMGFVLRRRGILTLHASCFSLAGRAFALCGWAGAGKSTTAAALALRGVPILCEDITALYARDATFYAAPGYPRVNLWPGSATILFRDALALPKITPNWEKRYLALDGRPASFDSHQRALGAVYILDERKDQANVPTLEALSPREATLALVENTYMNYLLNKQQRAKEFDAIARLVSSTPVKRLVPSSDPAKIALMCELLVADATQVAGLLAPPSAGLSQ